MRNSAGKFVDSESRGDSDGDSLEHSLDEAPREGTTLARNRIVRSAFVGQCARAALYLIFWLAPAGAQVIESIGDGYYRDSFEQPEKRSWSVRAPNEFDDVPQVVRHERTPTDATHGGKAELIVVTTDREALPTFLEYSLPAARRIDELSVRVAFKSDRAGHDIALRVVFPNQVDPRVSGSPLQTLISGDRYTSPGQWQMLSCSTTDNEVRQAVQRLHSELHVSSIEIQGAYVDRVYIRSTLPRGITTLRFDDLQFGPIVRTQPAPSRVTESRQRVQIENGRVKVDGRPFLPIMALHQGESPEYHSDLNHNLVWIPESDDVALMESFRDAGLWLAVTPEADPLRRDAAFEAFGPEMDNVFAWYLKTRLKAADKQTIIRRRKITRLADARGMRPFMADVVESERIYSRHISLLGVSRHIIGTTFSFDKYRDWLTHKRNLALPGHFMWTWIQTEPLPAANKWREALGRQPIVVEPEQLRLQVYTALASGYRGVGYWNWSALDPVASGSRERELAIKQLNLELQLLSELVATGELETSVDFQLEEPAHLDAAVTIAQQNQIARQRRTESRNFTAPDSLYRPGRPRGSHYTTATVAQTPKLKPSPVKAAAIRTANGKGMLLLPIWYDKDDQFVPGQASAKSLTAVVAAQETAQAYAITSTRVIGLERKKVAGGIRIRVPDFDQTAAILLTSDQSLPRMLEGKVAEIAHMSAQTHVDLAQAKLARVTAIDAELRTLGSNPPKTRRLLSEAHQSLNKASHYLQQSDFDAARLASEQSRRALRMLQRAHWKLAIAGQASPAFSPYTLSFETLPDHWRLQRMLSVHLPGPELLPSGGFESEAQFIQSGWENEANETSVVDANTELSPDRYRGRYSLRLWAMPKRGQDPPEFISSSPVIVTSPPIEVGAGQVIRVRGRVRVPFPIHGSHNGALIYDSICGKPGALRWQHAQNWQPFELVREIAETGPFRLSFVLDGLGHFQVDDLSVTAITPSVPPDAFRTAPADLEYTPGDTPAVSPAEIGPPPLANRPGDLSDYDRRRR